jgi:hypothetical protein
VANGGLFTKVPVHFEKYVVVRGVATLLIEARNPLYQAQLLKGIQSLAHSGLTGSGLPLEIFVERECHTVPIS